MDLVRNTCPRWFLSMKNAKEWVKFERLRFPLRQCNENVKQRLALLRPVAVTDAAHRLHLLRDGIW